MAKEDEGRLIRIPSALKGVKILEVQPAASDPPTASEFNSLVTQINNVRKLYRNFGLAFPATPEDTLADSGTVSPPLEFSITSVSPTTVSEAGGETLTINGGPFVNPTVTIGGVSATVSNVTSTAFNVTMPALAADVYDLVVTVGSTVVTRQDAITVQAAPTFSLLGVSPTSVSTAGGETLTVSGTGFSSPTATIGGTSVTPSSVTSTSFTVVMPAKAAGSYSLAVTVGGVTLTLTNVITASVAPGIYFSDDFASGDLSKVANGWLWNNPQGNFRVSVVSGFSKDGATGKCVKFTFPGGTGTPHQTQAQLAFTVGTSGLKTLWTDFWIYYPAGGEVIGGVTQPAWTRVDGGTGANNNKFFALYKHYTNAEGDALRRVFETWMPYPGATTLVEGQLRGGWRNQCSTVFSHDPVNDPVYSFERTDKRGVWRRVQIGHVMESAYLAADGHMEVWTDDGDGAGLVKRSERSGYTEICNTGAGANQWNYGYFLGYQNAACTTDQYCYISNIRFSNSRLTD